ncbi:hypothetical protein ACCO45_000677 [Purpureocillium lilacinum]|uniref:Uncharacterized protein n=1 Tax=Purpureocillium lilacinum TaxID=33203 RepID=A0ACC4E5Q4_PURLI
MVETTSNLAPTPRRQSQSAPATPRHPCEGTARGDAYDKGRLHMAMRRTARLHPVPRDLSTRPRLMPPMTKGTCSCRPCRPCPTKRLRLVTSPSSRWHTMARRTSPGTRLAVHGWRGGGPGLRKVVAASHLVAKSIVTRAVRGHRSTTHGRPGPSAEWQAGDAARWEKRQPYETTFTTRRATPIFLLRRWSLFRPAKREDVGYTAPAPHPQLNRQDMVVVIITDGVLVHGPGEAQLGRTPKANELCYRHERYRCLRQFRAGYQVEQVKKRGDTAHYLVTSNASAIRTGGLFCAPTTAGRAAAESPSMKRVSHAMRLKAGLSQQSSETWN